MEQEQPQWEYNKNYKRWICSECGDYAPEFRVEFTHIDWNGREYDDERLEPELTPYCPWCGAKMKVEKKNG